MWIAQFSSGFGAHVADDAGMIVGMDLLSSGSSPEETRRSMKSFALSLDGICPASRVGFHFLFKCGHKISDHCLFLSSHQGSKHRFASAASCPVLMHLDAGNVI
jgi:hypothetical protein